MNGVIHFNTFLTRSCLRIFIRTNKPTKMFVSSSSCLSRSYYLATQRRMKTTFSVSITRYQKFSSHSDQSETSEDHEEKEHQRDCDEDKDMDSIKSVILDHALDHVDELGWSREALSRGAEDAGYVAVTEGMFKNGGGDLALHLVRRSNERLVHFLQENVKSATENEEKLKTGELIRNAVEFRLRLMIPYIGRLPEGISFLLSPKILGSSSRELCGMVDDIWHYAGDTSTDINWYTKRGLLVKLYGSTELYMLQDQSPDFSDTWDFLDRRMRDLAMFGKVSRAVMESGNTLYDGIDTMVTVARNISGFPNRNR